MDRRCRTDWTAVLLVKVSTKRAMSISLAEVPISRGRIMRDWKPRHRSRSAPGIPEQEKEKGDLLCAPCRGLTQLLTGSASISLTSSRSAPALPLLSHRPRTDLDVDTCLVPVFEPLSDSASDSASESASDSASDSASESASESASDNRASQTTVTGPAQPTDTTRYRLNLFLPGSIDSNASFVGRRVMFYEFSCKTSISQGNQLGCSLCELLLDLLCRELEGDRLYWQRVFQSGLLRTRWHFNDVGVITGLEIRYSHDSPLYRDNIDFKLPLRVFADKYHSRVAREVIAPHSRMLLKSLEQLLWQCLKSRSSGHEHCSYNYENPPDLPTRILDLNDMEGSRNVRLIYGATVSRKPYMTLSHCWGAKGIEFKTTEQNHSDMCRRIPYCRIPRSFQDAIDIARILNIRYLWIDSFCIIQGSSSDWAQESVKMGAYYKGAVLNLGSGTTASAQGGILHSRPQVPVCKLGNGISLRHEDQHRSGTLTPRQTLGGMPREEPLIPCDTPLTKRAWVLQEEILCPRMIYFAYNQIYWYCNSGFFAEDGTQSLSPQKLKLRDIERASDPLQKWFQVVEHVTMRNITHFSDRLPCLSGIAGEFKRILGADYVAGLWSHDLHACLVWQSTKWTKKPQDGVAGPSWSWASLNGPVLWEGLYGHMDNRVPQHRDLVCLEEPKVYLTNDLNPFGQVDNGMLTIRAHCGQITVTTQTQLKSYKWKVAGWESEQAKIQDNGEARSSTMTFDDSARDNYGECELLLAEVATWYTPEPANDFARIGSHLYGACTAYLILERRHPDIAADSATSDDLQQQSDGVTYRRVGLAWSTSSIYPKDGFPGWDERRLKVI